MPEDVDVGLSLLGVLRDEDKPSLGKRCFTLDKCDDSHSFQVKELLFVVFVRQIVHHNYVVRLELAQDGVVDKESGTIVPVVFNGTVRFN